MSAEPFVIWKAEQVATDTGPATDTGANTTVDDLDPDIQGAVYELAEFAGLAGDETADADFQALPKRVQLALTTIGQWANFGAETGEQEPAEPASAGARRKAVTAAARRPIPKLLVPAAVVKAEAPTQADIWATIRSAGIAGRKQGETEEQAIDRYLDTEHGRIDYAAYKATGRDAGRAAEGVAVAKEATRLRPGEGRKMASDIIADVVRRLRKEHPNWSEAETWDWALQHDAHAIETYSRGELAELTTRKTT